MSISRVVAVSGAFAAFLAGCSAPAPQVTRATPLYSKSGEALCIPDDVYIPGTIDPRPNCDEICLEDPVAATNYAICPPYYDPQRPGGDPNDDDPLRPGTATGARP